MKALSLWQPWASLVAGGAKLLETRSWQTLYRGPLAIHAAKRWDGELADLCRTEPFARLLRRLATTPEALPRGCVVATCRLAAVYPIHTNYGAPYLTRNEPGDPPPPAVGAAERGLGLYHDGRYAWLLADVRPLSEPAPFRGAHMLFDWPGVAPASPAGPVTTAAPTLFDGEG